MGRRDIPKRMKAARSQLTEYSTRMCARRMEYSTLTIIAMLRSESALSRRSMELIPCVFYFLLRVGSNQQQQTHQQHCRCDRKNRRAIRRTGYVALPERWPARALWQIASRRKHQP